MRLQATSSEQLLLLALAGQGPYSRTSYDKSWVFWLVEMAEMAISTNQKPAIYRNLFENTGLV